MRNYPNQHALIVWEDGEYTSASENEEELAFAATNSVGQNQENEYEEEHLGTETSNKYMSIIVKRVLSTQMEKVEQDKCHNLFQTKLVIKEHSARVIIDGGSCNNLASMDMVEKLGLTTTQHPHP